MRALFARALPGKTGIHWYVIAFCLPLAYHSLAGLFEVAMGLFSHSGNAFLWITIALWLLAIVVIFCFGAKDLSRKPRFVLA